MWTRRQFLSKSALGVLGATGTALALPDNVREAMPDGTQSRDMATAQSDSAVERGLAFLASRQLNDGSWGTGGYTGNVAVTSVGALALMAGGNHPGRGKYGENVRRALKFVLDQGGRAGRAGPWGGDHPPGFLHNPLQGGQQGPMYSHGFGTLLLGEVCGMVSDPALARQTREGLTKAVQIIIRAQAREGGWRYTATPRDADISVTVCQMMALRSAKNAGAYVPGEVAKACIAYVKRCQNADGSFVYQASNRAFNFPGNNQGFARTAAGLAALFSAGIYKGPEIESGLNYLQRNRPARFGRQSDMHYFYGHYYAVQAMWTAGGQHWADWFPFIRDELVRHQEGDGSWLDMVCTHYGTAMACVILQVPNNYLPILQK